MNLPERFRELDLKRLILPIVLIIVFIGAAIGIVNYQQKAKLSKAPKLEVSGPANNSSTEDAQIVVEGTTDPGDTIMVSGSEVPVDSKGNFAVEMPVNVGENTIGVVAKNTAGKTSEQTLTITRTAVAAAPKSGASSGSATNRNLSSSGPEDYWIFAVALLAGAVTFWQLSRKNLIKVLSA